MFALAAVSAELLRGVERFLKRVVGTVPLSKTVAGARMNASAVVAKGTGRNMDARSIAGYVPVHINVVRCHTPPLRFVS
jgi:hypothetical protein